MKVNDLTIEVAKLLCKQDGFDPMKWTLLSYRKGVDLSGNEFNEPLLGRNYEKYLLDADKVIVVLKEKGLLKDANQEVL